MHNGSSTIRTHHFDGGVEDAGDGRRRGSEKFRGSTLCGISLSVWLHPPPKNEVGDEWNINFSTMKIKRKDNKFKKIEKNYENILEFLFFIISTCNLHILLETRFL
jgi:hypothetical protein